MHPTRPMFVQDSRPGGTPASCEQQLSYSMQMDIFSIHQTFRECSSCLHEPHWGFGVAVLQCCPNNSSALLWGQTYSDFLRLKSRSIYSSMKMLWLQLDSCHVSLSVVYKLRLRALSRNLDLVGGHIALGEHFDPTAKKKKKEIALWSGGDDEGRGHAEPCLWNWGLTDPLQGPTCRAWRSIELHSLRCMEQKDEAEQKEQKWNKTYFMHDSVVSLRKCLYPVREGWHILITFV